MRKSFGRLAMLGPLVAGILLSSNTTHAGEPMQASDTITSTTTAATNLWPWKDATPPGGSIGYIREKIPNLPVKPVPGKSYEDQVPDTTDLAEMCALTINALTCATSGTQDHEMYFSLYIGNPLRMSHNLADWCTPKYMEALPLLRVVTGSGFMTQVDQVWQDSILKSIGPDGLVYIPIQGKPWFGKELCWAIGIARTDGSLFVVEKPDPAKINELKKEVDLFARETVSLVVQDSGITQFTHPYYVGRMMKVLTAYNLCDGNPLWLDMERAMVDRMDKLAIKKDDYAYFPAYIYEPGATYDPASAKSAVPSGQPGGEINGRFIRAPALLYKRTGYKPALELSRRLTNFMLRHDGYFGPNGEFGDDRHFHAHCNYMLGMLEYADAAKDRDLLQLVRKSFEWAKSPANTGFNQLTGYAPEWGGLRNQTSEGCAVADMVAWALKLSAYGSGDYYEDAERWTRNFFAELQLTPAKAEQLAKQGRTMPVAKLLACETDDHVAERSVGAFGSWATGNEFRERGDDLLIMHCCTGNGARALYWAWRYILDCTNGELQVNMLLNRASPWADVYSYIPYQGRVDLKIKQDCTKVRVHAPEWIATGSTEITAMVGEKALPLTWRERYVELGALKKGQTVSLRFPIAERTVKEKMGGTEYTLIVRGNTVVSVDPPGKICPLFQRDYYRSDTPLMKQVKRFVADKMVDY